MEESPLMNHFAHAAVIGAGTMGHGIAQMLAVNGSRVTVVDRSLDRARQGRENIASNLRIAAEEGFLPGADVNDVMERIRPANDVATAVAGAGIVVEAVFEDLAVKREVWQTIDSQAPEDAIIASNTSSIDINELVAALTTKPQRGIGTHWYNPPHIVPCVEVIPADATSEATVASTVALLRAMGKKPAITKSVPGFVGNRIQLAMAAEAYRCLEEGIATAEDIDSIVRSSFGFRLGAYGPLQVADLAGLDTYLAVYDYLTERCGNPWHVAPALLRRLVEEGHTGVKALRGVYEYSPDDAARLRAERDRVLYRQLRIGQAGDQAAHTD